MVGFFICCKNTAIYSYMLKRIKLLWIKSLVTTIITCSLNWKVAGSGVYRIIYIYTANQRDRYGGGEVEWQKN